MPMTGVLAGGGELGGLLRALDWSTTPLGHPRIWPQSLRSAASICLNSRFPIAIYWGPELALLYNEAWSPILGAKHPWAMGQPAQAVWPEIWPEIGPLFASVHQTGEGVWQQDQLLPMHRHGYTEECYFNFTFSPIRGEEGGVVGIFNAVIETTFRVLEERRSQLLRDLAANLSGAQSTTEVCVRTAAALAGGTLDVPFSLLYLRDPGGATFELVASAGVTLPEPLRPAMLDPNDPQAVWPAAGAVRLGGAELVEGVGRGFGAAVRGDPWPEPVEQALIVPILGGQATEPIALLVAGISPRRALDDAYRTFIERVAQQVGSAIATANAYTAERRRAEALAAIDEAKTAFFSNVSHEFRTPLTLMLGPLEDVLAQAESLSLAQREQLDVVQRNALRLLRLVNTLLDFSRIEAGRVRAAYAPTDLSAYTAELASVFRSAVERAGLRLSVDCPPLPEPIYVDHEMWEQIVFNLLSNALKFTFTGEIAVALRIDTGAAELSVRDTGTGIPAAEIPRLFERFHRVQGAQGRSFEGSGIGLALVQELVRLHGGEVRVSSLLGQGTTFTVRIPTGAAHLPTDRMISAQRAATPGSRGDMFVQEALRWLPQGEPAGQLPEDGLPAERVPRPVPSGRILLADDNADMRAYVHRLLSPLYDVVMAEDGVAALRQALEEPVDLVLSDVMMPGLDGFELLRALRADERTRELPVLLLSARAGEEARIEGMAAGADDYLVKPFSARELLARVGAHLDIAQVRHRAARRERELRAEAESAQAQLQQLLAVINDLFLAFDEQWQFVFANQPLLEQTGLSHEHLRGMTIWELFPELADTDFERTVRQALAERTPRRFEYFHPLRKRWFENRIYPAESGGALFITEITEQKCAELNRQFLLDAGERLSTPTTVSDLMTALGPMIGAHFGVSHCAFIEFDPAADRAIVHHDWRADPSELSYEGAHDVAEFLTVEARRGLAVGQPLVISDVARDLRTAVTVDRHQQLGIGAHLHTPFLSDGVLKFALALYHREPYAWRDDEIATLRELSARIWTRVERLRAEAALRASEAKLQSALDGGRLGAWSWDPMTGATEADARTLELFGIPPATFTGEADAVIDCIHPDDQATVAAALERAAHPEGSYEAEFRILLPDGQVRWLTGTGRPRVEADGRVSRVYGVNADISERKQAEARMRTLYEQEQAARTQAEEANRLKDEFLATVSHELRTPLTALLGYAHLLQSRKRDEAYVARTVEKIVRSAQAQAQITEDLLDIARIVSGKLRIDPAPLDLAAVVHAALDTVRPAMEAKALRLQVELHPEATAVVGDGGRLQQVVWNLLTNATKFTPHGGAIAVRLVVEGPFACLTVKDNGQGIQPAFLPYVFERFRQGDSSSQRSHGGLGLGLSIVRHLVELHGGTVEAASAGAHKGATFTVRLPLVSHTAMERSVALLTDNVPFDGKRCPPELQGLRVLLVDDQPAILELLEEILIPCGAVVRTCANARGAFELLQAWRPDLLVSDIAMPDEDGYWLMRAIRALPPEAGGKTPAVALTAYVRMEDRLRVLEAGFQQYVPKPVDPDELRTILAGVAHADNGG